MNVGRAVRPQILTPALTRQGVSAAGCSPNFSEDHTPISEMLPEPALIRFGIAAMRYPYLWENGRVKTTVEIPDTLFRKAKASAAENGISLKDFFSHAVRDYLARGSAESKQGSAPVPAPPWRSAFGGLRHLHKETQRINRIIEEEFKQIDEDQWR
jgi:hypothetical protein